MDKISKEIVLELWKSARDEVSAEPLKIKNGSFLESIIIKLNSMIENGKDPLK